MPIESAIVSKIKAVAGVASAVSDRVAPVEMTEGLARPNIVYQVLGTRQVNSNSGPTGLRLATIQVSYYADDYETAKGIAAAVARPSSAAQPGINGFQGLEGDVFIQSILLDDERDAPQPPATGQGQGVAGVVHVFKVGYSE